MVHQPLEEENARLKEMKARLKEMEAMLKEEREARLKEAEARLKEEREAWLKETERANNETEARLKAEARANNETEARLKAEARAETFMEGMNMTSLVYSTDPASPPTGRDLLFALENNRWPGILVDRSESTTTKSPSKTEMTLEPPLRYVSHVPNGTLPTMSTSAKIKYEQWLQSPVGVVRRPGAGKPGQTTVLANEVDGYKVTDGLMQILSDAHGTSPVVGGTGHLLCCDSQSTAKGDTSVDHVLVMVPREDYHLRVPILPIEGKTTRVLAHHLQSLLDKFDIPLPVIGSGDITPDEATMTLSQIYTEMRMLWCRNGMILAPHVFFFVEIVQMEERHSTEKNPTNPDSTAFSITPSLDVNLTLPVGVGPQNVMLIEGPYYRKDVLDDNLCGGMVSKLVNGETPHAFMATFGKVLEYIVKSSLIWEEVLSKTALSAAANVRIDFANTTQQPLLRTLERHWAISQLACSPAIAIYCTDGSLLGVADRRAPALTFPMSWITWVFICLQWVLNLFPSVLHLRVSSLAGRGISANAYRGSYAGVPFIIKLPRSPGAITKEWASLRCLLPRDPDVGSRLPIPTYYGLFHMDGEDVLVASDNGVPLAALRRDECREKWSLVESAVSSLKAAGIQPTDVNEHNVVWDGSCVTIIDFVDDDVL